MVEWRAGLVQAVESYRLWPEGPGFESRSPRIAQARVRLATDTLPQTPHWAGALCTRYALFLLLYGRIHLCFCALKFLYWSMHKNFIDWCETCFSSGFSKITNWLWRSFQVCWWFVIIHHQLNSLLNFYLTFTFPSFLAMTSHLLMLTRECMRNILSFY